MVIAVVAVIAVVVVAFGAAVGKWWLRRRRDKARRQRMTMPLEHTLVIPGEESLTTAN